MLSSFQPVPHSAAEIFDPEELDILYEQAKANLPPGGEAPLFEIWRCEHCREIRPWRDGGDSWTGPGVFCAEERDFLGLCCDKCWHTIVSTVGAVFSRYLGRNV